MAAWPVIAHDGTVVACCHQETVDRRPVPDHLRLGHIDVDDWVTVRGRALSSPVLRMIRSTGPTYLTTHQSAASGACRSDQPGYCTTCRRLSERPAALDLAHRLAAGPAGQLLDRHATRVQVEAGPVAFVRRHGYGRYADLVTLSPRTEPNRVDAP
jgi:hypothetical protein